MGTVDHPSHVLPRPGRRAFLKGLAALPLLSLSGVPAYARFVEPRWMEVTRHTAPIRGLPSAFDRFSIAQISDIHYNPGMALRYVEAAVERVLRLPDETATVALGITAGLLGLLAVALFADGLWGQGWNTVGAQAYQTEAGKGVTGFLPAAGFVNGDGTGQLIAQLAGAGAIGLPAFLVGWLLFWGLRLVSGERRDTAL